MKQLATFRAWDLRNGFSISSIDETFLSEPASLDEWKLITIDLPSEVIGQGEPVAFLFVFENFNQPTVYIDDLSVVSGLPTSNHTLLAEPLIRFFPNPASDHLMIHWEGDLPFQSSMLKISNAQGQVVFHRDELLPADKDMELDISSLPGGLYFLSLGSGHRQLVRKFVKLK